jgi:hypothetical protein
VKRKRCLTGTTQKSKAQSSRTNRLWGPRHLPFTKDTQCTHTSPVSDEIRQNNQSTSGIKAHQMCNQSSPTSLSGPRLNSPNYRSSRNQSIRKMLKGSRTQTKSGVSS